MLKKKKRRRKNVDANNQESDKINDEQDNDNQGLKLDVYLNLRPKNY